MPKNYDDSSINDIIYALPRYFRKKLINFTVDPRGFSETILRDYLKLKSRSGTLRIRLKSLRRFIHVRNKNKIIAFDGYREKFTAARQTGNPISSCLKSITIEQ